MSDRIDRDFDPSLDLVLTRDVGVPPELVWRAWTVPEELVQWFAPRPWSTAACEIDLRPGGIFRTVMRSPEGELHPSVGCILEAVPNERLAWTDAMLPGFRPSADPFFSAIITLEARGTGTRYTATARHRDRESRERHEAMGFHMGWGSALDQLVAMAEGRAGTDA